MRFLLLIPLLVLIMVGGVILASAQSVPDWVKNTAGWWSTDAISEGEFVNAIEYLVNEGIITVQTAQPTDQSQGVPDWVKNTAGWWSTDAISEGEFVNAIGYLVNVGIIKVESESECVTDLLKFFDEKDTIIDVCQKHQQSENLELIPFENEMRFNSLGLRGEEFSEKKESGVYRIFVVGGSTIAGVEVFEEETIPGLMQKMFDKTEENVQVINAGVSGGNTITERKLITDKLSKYDPDLIIMFDGWNDLSADYPIMGNMQMYENICGMAGEEGYSVVFTQQPIAGFGNKNLTFQEMVNSLTGEDHHGFQLIQAIPSYEFQSRELKKLEQDAGLFFGKGVCNYYDLRGVFDNVTGPIYWDQGHMLQAGNLIIAENFFNISMKIIQSDFAEDYTYTTILSKHNSQPIQKFLLDELVVEKNSFNNLLRDVKDNNSGKGNYFDLKNQIGVSNILVGKDFRGLDISNFDFNGMDLTGSNFSGHDLRKIDFSDSIIRNVDFSFTNLENYNFQGKDIRGSNFNGSNLKNVNFVDSTISKTIQFYGKNCIDEDPFLEKIKNAYCVQDVILNEEIFRTIFSNAQMSGAKFGSDNVFQGIFFTDFTNSDLTYTKWNNVLIQGSNFYNTNFENSIFNIFTINASSYEKSNLSNSSLQSGDVFLTDYSDSNIQNSSFRDMMFVDTDFTHADLNGSGFVEIDWYGDNKMECIKNQVCE